MADVITVPEDATEIRCPFCNKLLAKGVVAKGTILELPCTRGWRHCQANMPGQKKFLKFQWI